MIQSLGKGAKLWISDIKKAFRLLPVWPGDFDSNSTPRNVIRVDGPFIFSLTIGTPKEVQTCSNLCIVS
jgi:hypothetical protein